MKQELQSAANFIVHLLRINKKCYICEAQLKKYQKCLIDTLYRRFRDHWFPEKPDKGSSYRIIQFFKIESWLSQAGEACKLKSEFLQEILPNNFMMWINPLEVLYRFGENGRIYILYDHNSMEPWIPNALINKPAKKTVKKNQIKPLVIKSSQKISPLEEIAYRLNTKRTISIELLTAYVSS
jgi:protein Tob/BTG